MEYTKRHFRQRNYDLRQMSNSSVGVCIYVDKNFNFLGKYKLKTLLKIAWFVSFAQHRLIVGVDSCMQQVPDHSFVVLCQIVQLF